MEFALWTDDPELAEAAAAAGVGRIGPDLEVAGKALRQTGTDSLQSQHAIESLPAIRGKVGNKCLFVHCNPPTVARGVEIEQLIQHGVRSIMLPMVRTVDDTRGIARAIDGRAELIVMIEHADALPLADALARIDGVSALYVGTNDLALSLRRASRFAVMTPDILDPIARVAKTAGIGFGFFGLGRAGDATLPVPSELVYAEWVRYGATFCILARSFAASPTSIGAELDTVRQRIAYWRHADAGALANAHAEFLHRCGEADRYAAGRAASTRQPIMAAQKHT